MTDLYVISLSETSQIVVCGVVILSKALNRDALKSKYSKIPGDQGVILTTLKKPKIHYKDKIY